MMVKNWTKTAILAAAVWGQMAQAQTATDDVDVSAVVEAAQIAAPAATTPLFLEVFINGESTQLIAEFTHHTNNRFSSTRSELTEVGIRPPFGIGGDVYLDTISGLEYVYDSTGQRLYITVPNRSRLPKVLSGSRRASHVAPERSFGAVVNYALATEFGPDSTTQDFDFTGLTGSVDGWIYAPFGTLSNTGFFRADATNVAKVNYVRQETRLEFNNTKHAVSLSFGDFQSSTVAWSRPIRMGGVQFRKDFSLRSDIVTEQLFTFEGAAAVPSTVDVFIENNRTFSGQVGSGPFLLDDVPVFSGAGDAVVVIRDADGNERTEEVSFFASRNLLKKGRFDFSFEAGKAREAFGTQSNEYGDDTVYSASLKYGATERVTLEAHLEGKNDLSMGGIGFTTVPFRRAEVTLSAGASKYQGNTAAFFHGEFRTKIKNVDVQFSTLRAEEGFADLAFATGVDFLGAGAIQTGGSLLEFPTATDVLSLGLPMKKQGQNLGMSFVRSARASSDDAIASVSYARNLGIGDASISVFGSHNLVTDNNRIALSLAVPLGKKTQVRSSLVTDASGALNSNISLSRPLGDAVGDYGYQAQLADNSTNAFGSVRGSYRTRFAKVSGEVSRSSTNTFARGVVEGSIVFTGGKLAAGNAIHDSFALVDTGVANVPVHLQNRPVAKTGPAGRALVPGLTSFRRNRISVDVNDVPTHVTLNASAMEVIPARRGGAFVDFSGTEGQGVLVTVQDANGNVLRPGLDVKVNGNREQSVVGYDGLVWVENVKPNNRLRIDTAAGPCQAKFTYKKTSALQQAIGPIVCQ
ncbi:fimbria/pilus outer membrane usher protein [Amylibacter sp. IMCC11727]|uniref:fimbria/pilus outer membrane usher protein n=1 Tax=Amylibacter sp. IMCC11727 TaxID=3039851 RepID=UPI00244E59A1|nr:fimbria/pilus outer membrane usher protein [Amylibacter sp. IMCC11727]WGI22686.1 fimbria/pilus outer membrane usher protein [Amylibacter sp. IMCC11727]